MPPSTLRSLRKKFTALVFSVISVAFCAFGALAQSPPKIEPGVSQELAKWRAARYSDIRYKLNLTLEKMSPVLKGTIEIRVRVSRPHVSKGSADQSATLNNPVPIILDWRKIKGYEMHSTISNVTVNGTVAHSSDAMPNAHLGGGLPFEEQNEHLTFTYGVVTGENVIKLDFTSPILTSGSAITRYIDKEDGSEYIYSLFVPSDASTAFPVFDQPDLKARFSLDLITPADWVAVSNTDAKNFSSYLMPSDLNPTLERTLENPRQRFEFAETQPISSYIFAFAAGPFKVFDESGVSKEIARFRQPRMLTKSRFPHDRDPKWSPNTIQLYDAPEGARAFVRRSQAEKFKPHAAEVFRLNREAIKYLETYFDYKFPWPKYDLVLIPEFPFGGMEHAGATFLREQSIIFPQEPTRSDHISRATLIFHEAAHQWFGDTVTMRWFDDLWLKEGFATFMAYKALEKVMPEANAWKVFYERVKQAAYQTDSTRGTTAIYQPIANLSAAKSAYGAIVYNKAPAFLRQAEFYLGEDKFQTAVRAFLKKHEFANAGWGDLVNEFRNASWNRDVIKGVADSMQPYWTENWINKRGVPIYRLRHSTTNPPTEPISAFSPAMEVLQSSSVAGSGFWNQKTKVLQISGSTADREVLTPELNAARGFVSNASTIVSARIYQSSATVFIFQNYHDYGYGIFLLDEKSRDYVLKNIQNEKDPFLRSMMWGALWDSVREGELDPRVYVELAIKNLPAESDETITASILARVSTAMSYYISEKTRDEIAPKLETLLLERIKTSSTLGQRITFYRAFLNASASTQAKQTLKDILAGKFQIDGMTLKTKDKFDIVTRLAIIGDADAAKLLADLEKTETSDDAKRYAYAARAGIATAENKAKYWDDFVNNKTISESWIEAAFGPWNSIRHSELTLPYLTRALKELPNHKRNRKIFFVNGWLAAFIGGQRSSQALDAIDKFLADNPNLDNDLRLKILENSDLIERAVKIRKKFSHE